MLALLEAADVSGNHKPRPLPFESQRHKILLDELRHLYTAITRARVNVWMYEENASKRGPMFDFLIRRGLVDVMSGAEMGSNAAGLTKGTSTSTTDWDRQGDNLLAKKACFMAAHCFSKANNPIKQSLALAQHKVMEAIKEPKVIHRECP
jgi:ATP-dependent exoDNAse (exonuclease V) beta subunit